jgi:catalase
MDGEQRQLDGVRLDPPGSALTTQQGMRVDHTDHSLSVGDSSPALSQTNTATDSIRSRKVAVLVADGVEAGPVNALAEALRERGAIPELLAPTDGAVRSAAGQELAVDPSMTTMITMASVLYDAVVVGGGTEASTLGSDGYAMLFIAEAAKRAKPVAALGSGVELVNRATASVITLSPDGDGIATEHGVLGAPSATIQLPDGLVESFTDLLPNHRVWSRPTAAIPR